MEDVKIGGKKEKENVKGSQKCVVRVLSQK